MTSLTVEQDPTMLVLEGPPLAGTSLPRHPDMVRKLAQRKHKGTGR